MFARPVPATVIGTLLCTASVAVFVVALLLANTDRLKEQRATRRHHAPENSNDAVADPVEVHVGDKSGGQEAPHSSETGELEGGLPVRERDSSYEDGSKADEADEKPVVGLPWSLLVLGNGTLCGAESADDSTVPPSASE